MAEQRNCEDCGRPLEVKRTGRPPKRCAACKKAAKQKRDRRRWQETHPGWEERRAAANELQRVYRARKKAARENLTEVTAGDLTRARGDLVAANLIGRVNDGESDDLPKPASSRRKSIVQASVDEARRSGQLEADTSFEAEDDKNNRLKLKLIWPTLLRRDPMSSINDNGFGAFASSPIEDLYVYGPEEREVDLFDGQRQSPIHIRSQGQGFAAVHAASGDALEAIAEQRGARKPRPEDAEILIRWQVGQLKPWEKQRYAGAIRRLETGEIRDARGKPIVGRQGPPENPTTLDEALVALAYNEGLEGAA